MYDKITTKIMGLAVLLTANVSAAEPTKLFSITGADDLFFEDAIAVDGGRNRLSVIMTDGAAQAKTRIVDLTTGKDLQSFNLMLPATSARVATQLFASTTSAMMAAVQHETDRDRYWIAFWNADKPTKVQTYGPFDAVSPMYRGTEGEVVGLGALSVVRAKSGGATITAKQFALNTAKAAGTATIKLRGDDTFGKPSIRPLYWLSGYQSVVGVRAGTYDKKQDTRLPDEVVNYDPVRATVTSAAIPADWAEWTKVAQWRSATKVVAEQVARVAEDNSGLQWINADNRVAVLKTKVAWSLYEPKSLQQQVGERGQLTYVSLTVDPVNEQAVKRQKADLERLDLYRFDAAKGLSLIAQIPTDKRPSKWIVSGSHFIYLRKLKGFGRGGNQIDVYKLD